MDKVYCPYCGSRMNLKMNRIGLYAYECAMCMSVSPIMTTKEDAQRMALKRYVPPQKPLTLEELIESVGTPVWFESHGTYMGKKGWWMIPQKIIKMSGLSIHGANYIPADPAKDKNVLIKFVCEPSSQSTELGLDAYGTVWRAWKTMPTDEEREAAKWE